MPASRVLYAPEAQGSLPRASHCSPNAIRVPAAGVPYVPRAVAPQVLLEEAQHEDYVLCNALKARRFAHSACAVREPCVSRA